jgi:hypothetical protein
VEITQLGLVFSGANLISRGANLLSRGANLTLNNHLFLWQFTPAHCPQIVQAPVNTPASRRAGDLKLSWPLIGCLDHREKYFCFISGIHHRRLAVGPRTQPDGSAKTAEVHSQPECGRGRGRWRTSADPAGRGGVTGSSMSSGKRAASMASEGEQFRSGAMRGDEEQE